MEEPLVSSHEQGRRVAGSQSALIREQLLGQSQSAPFMTPLPLVALSLSINAAWNWIYHLMSLHVQDAFTIMN
jgi:hypothetical protein